MNMLHSNVAPFKATTALTVNTRRLMELLNCGRPTAVKIGIDAGAKIVVGERKILWHVRAIERYLDSLPQ